ncbi:MAG: energy transducer TonB [bacterium]|nr:energy transducer TonB [bacterium]
MSSNSQETQEAYLRHNFAAIRGAIERKLRYPALARRQGLSGQVLVSFVVERNGGIRDLRVLRGSGFGLLDDSALSAVRRAAPFPPASSPVRVSLPVRYHLNP